MEGMYVMLMLGVGFSSAVVARLLLINTPDLTYTRENLIFKLYFQLFIVTVISNPNDDGEIV